MTVVRPGFIATSRLSLVTWHCWHPHQRNASRPRQPFEPQKVHMLHNWAPRLDILDRFWCISP